MAFKKRGRPIIPKVVFQLKSGGFFQVFVKDENEAESIMTAWDTAKAAFLARATDDGAQWMEFRPTDEHRVVISEVVAVAYVGPKDDDE
jgi:hypothetical protein